MPIVARRVLLSHAFAAALFAGVAGAADTPAVAPEPFFKHADYGVVKLSPSGKHLGVLAPALEGRVVLAVIDLETKATHVAAAIDVDIVQFDWLNDGRLVFTVADLQGGSAEQYSGGWYAVNRDGTLFRRLPGRPHTLLRDGSDDILMVSRGSSGRGTNIYRMNTVSSQGSALKTFDNPGNVVRWIADRKGVVRAAFTDEKSMASRVLIRSSDDAPWVPLAEFHLGESRFMPIAFDGDGTLIVASNIGRDTMAIYRYDTERKKLGEELAAHPQIDLTGGLVFDRRKNRIVGLAYDGPEPVAIWSDEDWAQRQKTVDAALPGHMNRLYSTDGGSRTLVFSYSDTDPGSYYVLDMQARRLEYLITERKAIKPDLMPTRKPIRYVARDGLEIPAYLTLPRGNKAKNLPLVLYVHHGPWIRGAHWRWSATPAFLASLGYAVLEPEFRGSTGWGRRLHEAGWKQWGGAMQDDLVDGVKWLAKEGTIDATRVCIMGASYGGYAVMMGLARDPEHWRCGVNLVGVTDINLYFDISWSDYAYSDWIKFAAREMIGDPDKDAAMFKAGSPLENAAKIKAPVLMAYGLQDRRVPIIHGEKMRDALLQQGTPVEWIVYKEEGHGFMLEKNRFDLYARIARFLIAHNPPH